MTGWAHSGQRLQARIPALLICAVTLVAIAERSWAEDPAPGKEATSLGSLRVSDLEPLSDSEIEDVEMRAQARPYGDWVGDLLRRRQKVASPLDGGALKNPSLPKVAPGGPSLGGLNTGPSFSTGAAATLNN